MFKYLINLFLFAVVSFALNAKSFAALTGTVQITGTVPITCGIVVTPQSGANISNLSTGATNLLVAIVTETCNDPDGYTVTLQGTNSASYTGLFTDSVSGSTLAFTNSYDGTAVSSTTVTNTTGTANGVNKNVNITYSANSGLTGSVSNTYSETLTFTIAAK